MAEVVMETMEEEVQEGLQPDLETTMTTTAVNQRKWNLPLIMQVKLKEQCMTQ